MLIWNIYETETLYTTEFFKRILELKDSDRIKNKFSELAEENSKVLVRSLEVDQDEYNFTIEEYEHIYDAMHEIDAHIYPDVTIVFTCSAELWRYDEGMNPVELIDTLDNYELSEGTINSFSEVARKCLTAEHI